MTQKMKCTFAILLQNGQLCKESLELHHQT